ncbi:Glycosyl transferase family 2 [Asanoa ishikariensis]|uniref:Glycosyl transferase family 2 n=1 Tax=Asanoa ishikariensis TaxID=137265 RepID=A0A1H3R725_9ACTN|nr:glycosyltransferase family 2 protein [Asanoa ishikariensis]SDZ21642.1 Glycosyl transferase family 2 [Asanoa ishikariensis]
MPYWPLPRHLDFTFPLAGVDSFRSMSAIPEVSVVIPTRSRPALVTRAVRSVLAQTFDNIEVIVVVDGPDDETVATLQAIDDPRLRTVVLPRRGGAPNARNAGVGAAQAPWTAMLDDDDEWLPDKLAVQLDEAKAANVPLPIVTCRLINRTPRADIVMPRRLPDHGEPRSEYLTVRRGLTHGDGFVQTSMILAPTELFRKVPFTVGLPRLQELDWTLRALAQDGVDLFVAPEPLLVWHTDENRPRLSLVSPWEKMFVWSRANRSLFTPRAYAAVTLSVISSMAVASGSFTVFRAVLSEARRHGRPGVLDYVTFLQIWLLPPGLRAKLRDLVLRRRPAASPGGSVAP